MIVFIFKFDTFSKDRTIFSNQNDRLYFSRKFVFFSDLLSYEWFEPVTIEPFFWKIQYLLQKKNRAVDRDGNGIFVNPFRLILFPLNCDWTIQYIVGPNETEIKWNRWNSSIFKLKECGDLVSNVWICYILTVIKNATKKSREMLISKQTRF